MRHGEGMQIPCAHVCCANLLGPSVMIITLSVDNRVAERASKAAQAMGKSLNQAMRDYLELMAGAHLLEVEVQAFEQSARQTPGRLNGWRFDRDEANRRS